MTIYVDRSMIHCTCFCMPMRRSLHDSCFNIHLLMLDVLQSICGNDSAPMPAFSVDALHPPQGFIQGLLQHEGHHKVSMRLRAPSAAH